MLQAIDESLKEECDILVKQWLLKPSTDQEQLVWSIYFFVRIKMTEAAYNQSKQNETHQSKT